MTQELKPDAPSVPDIPRLSAAKWPNRRPHWSPYLPRELDEEEPQWFELSPIVMEDTAEEQAS